MIKARPKYPTDMYGTIYIDNIQKAVRHLSITGKCAFGVTQHSLKYYKTNYNVNNEFII
jgi:hypothetical protein